MCVAGVEKIPITQVNYVHRGYINFGHKLKADFMHVV